MTLGRERTAVAIETKAIQKAKKEASSAQKRLERMREESEDALETATRTGVTMGGAFAMAWWQGRYPMRREILGVDASLFVGGSLTLVALMGWAGDQDIIFESLGTGALATYAMQKGYAFGAEQRQRAGEQAPVTP